MKEPYIKDCERGCRRRKNEMGEWEIEPCHACSKLADFNWMADLPAGQECTIFEIRFKNTHKGFYQNSAGLVLAEGDVVAVEATSGHDIGIVSLGGSIVLRQLAHMNINPATYEFKKIYRKAKPFDIEKWQESIAREHVTMIKSRQIAAALKLDMKIGDVEFQGDGSKAIFYYIADERVDFRELIKRLAEEFRIRIEMRQIGARQEAGRIGGIGVCGRELCCAQWMSGFTTVNTNAARWQDLSLNPQKLTGQCSKLKCCLNHEVSAYVDAQKDFPRVTAPIETFDGQLFLQKTDILKGIMFFTPDPQGNGEYFSIPVERVKEYLALNKKGAKAPSQEKEVTTKAAVAPGFKSAVGEDSITRFDKKKKSHHKNRTHNHNEKNSNVPNANPTNSGGNTPKEATGGKENVKKESHRRNNSYRKNNKPAGEKPANHPNDKHPKK